MVVDLSRPAFGGSTGRFAGKRANKEREEPRGIACLRPYAQNILMKFLDPDTEGAVRAFLAQLPENFRVEHAILYGSRARGEGRPDSDADVALIVSEGADDWDTAGNLAELAYYVFLDTGILIQPVPISKSHWLHPERFPRPGFLRNVAREGIIL